MRLVDEVMLVVRTTTIWMMGKVKHQANTYVGNAAYFRLLGSPNKRVSRRIALIREKEEEDRKKKEAEALLEMQRKRELELQRKEQQVEQSSSDSSSSNSDTEVNFYIII